MMKKMNVPFLILLYCCPLDLIYFFATNYCHSMDKLYCNISTYTIISIPIFEDYSSYIHSQCLSGGDTEATSIISLMVKISLALMFFPYFIYGRFFSQKWRELDQKGATVKSSGDFRDLFGTVIIMLMPCIFAILTLFSRSPENYPTFIGYKIINEDAFILMICFAQSAFLIFLEKIFRIIILEDV